jgi:hypothetical protein
MEAASRSLHRQQHTTLTVSHGGSRRIGRANYYAVRAFALAAGVGVFVTRFTSVSKRFAALAPLRASLANRASVSSRVSVFFMG